MKRIIILIGVVLVIATLALIPFLIKVKIICKTQYGDCPEQILAKLKVFDGRNLISAKRGIRKILGLDYLVSDYTVQYKIPNILHVDLLIKKAIIAFKDGKSGLFILVDKDGNVLSSSQSSVLPTITTDRNLPGIGQKIDVTDDAAANIAGGLYQMYQVGETYIQDGSLLVELPGQIRVIFPLDGDSQILLGALRLIYSKVREDGNLAGYSQIDLRYRNPVLR